MRGLVHPKVVIGALVAFCMLGPASAANPRRPVAKADPGEVESLRVAIEDLIETFGDRYPRGREFLARLKDADAEGFRKLRREALAAPLAWGLAANIAIVGAIGLAYLWRSRLASSGLFVAA